MKVPVGRTFPVSMGLPEDCVAMVSVVELLAPYWLWLAQLNLRRIGMRMPLPVMIRVLKLL